MVISLAAALSMRPFPKRDKPTRGYHSPREITVSVITSSGGSRPRTPDSKIVRWTLARKLPALQPNLHHQPPSPYRGTPASEQGVAHRPNHRARGRAGRVAQRVCLCQAVAGRLVLSVSRITRDSTRMGSGFGPVSPWGGPCIRARNHLRLTPRPECGGTHWAPPAGYGHLN